MKYLTSEQIMEAAQNVVNGRIVRIGYTSELPLKKDWQDKGYRIYKLTETSVRLGVKYDNITEVIEKRAAAGAYGRSARANNYTWIIPNKVQFNSNTNRTYLRCTTLKQGSNSRTKFLVHNPHDGWHLMTREELMKNTYSDMVKENYFTKTKEVPVVFTVPFEHIYKLGQAQA